MARQSELHDRPEQFPHRRRLISAFIVVTLLAVVASNLPPQSSLGSYAMKVFGPYLRETGLDQKWNVFAPDPLSYSVYVSARIRYADGSSESWSYPFGEKVLGAYRFYRWEKLSWRVNTVHPATDILREQAARWVVREKADERRHPVEVALVRRYADTPTLGSNERRVWRDLVFYRLRLADGRSDDG